MKNFVPTRRSNPCQLCGDTKGKCRETDSVLLCMTFADAREHIPGLRFIGQTKDSLWGKWVTDDQSDWTEQEREQWRREQQVKRQYRQAEENQRRAAALSPVERDRRYQQLQLSTGLSQTPAA
jgi:ribosomal protein S14